MDTHYSSSRCIQERGIVESLMNPAVVLDDSLVALAANSEFYSALGISPSEVEGRPVRELVTATNCRQAWQVIVESALALDDEWKHMQTECAVAPGMYGALSVTSRRLNRIDHPGDLVLVELHDITDEPRPQRRLRKLNDALIRRGIELQRLNSDLESFNRWVSHDLRTPLRITNILVHRLLESDPVLPPPALDTARVILECTREMGKLIEDLLAFSQVDRKPLKRRRTNIARLTRKALAKLHLEGAPIQRMHVVIDDLPACHADPALMQQVLLNLLSNAITSTSSCEQPEILVGFEQGEGGGTAYFVRDNGVGFKPGEAESLFLPFFNQCRVQSPQGTGVGLTLVQRIIERHGGRIWAEGEPGRGATFYFQLGEDPKLDSRPRGSEGVNHVGEQIELQGAAGG